MFSERGTKGKIEVIYRNGLARNFLITEEAEGQKKIKVLSSQGSVFLVTLGAEPQRAGATLLMNRLLVMAILNVSFKKKTYLLKAFISFIWANFVNSYTPHDEPRQSQ